MTKRTVMLWALWAWVLAGPARAQTDAERGFSVLQQGVHDANEGRREKAVLALGLLAKDERARQLAEAGLADPSPGVRAAAATALGQIGLEASIPRLQEAVKDKEAEVVFSAASALYVLGDPLVYGLYYAVLTGERKTGEPLLESQLDMLKDPQALARIGFEAGMGLIPFGGVGTKVFKQVTADKVSPVRAAAAQKLVSDPDPRSARALADATLDKEWLVRASAVSAIAKRGDPELVSAVIPLLEDEEDTVRFSAAAAVVRLSAARVAGE
jgi:HEAT repeat protein